MPSGQLGQVLRHLRRLIGQQSLEDLPDAQLLEQFLARRDAAAFEALVQRYGPLVLGVCRRVLQDEHDAEDAFQATFLVFARRAAAIRSQGAVGSWLAGTAYRIALKARAAAARRREQEKQAGTQLKMDKASETLWRELRPVLDEELNRLPAKYRMPLVLCYLEGKSNEAAARELGWAPGSMSYRLAQAKERLRERLIHRGVALTGTVLGPALFAHATVPVPDTLVSPTVQGALLFAAGKAVGVVPAQVIALAEGILHAAAMLKAVIIALIGMFLLLLVGGVGLYVHRTPGGGRTQIVDNGPHGPEIKPLDPEHRIAVLFSDNQRFGISCLKLHDPRNPEKPKLLTRHERGNTNNTVLRIDGSEYFFGQPGRGARWAKDPKTGLVQKEVKVGERKWLSVVEYSEQKVLVTQAVEIVVGEQTHLYDTALVKYTVENLDTKPHTVGLRAMLDTYIGTNDGVPFLIPPTDTAPGYLLDTMGTFEGEQVPKFVRALETSNLNDKNATVAELGLRLRGVDPLSRLVICRWPNEHGASEARWEWPFQAMNEPAGAEKDSCVALYWDKQPIGPGDRRTVGFTYGLGRTADGTGTEEEMPMRLLAGGSSRVGSTFTLTAYIKEARTGQKVKLQLPPELVLAAGQVEEQRIEVQPGKDYAQVSWRVKATKVGKFRVLGVWASRSAYQEVHIREHSIFE